MNRKECFAVKFLGIMTALLLCAVLSGTGQKEAQAAVSSDGAYQYELDANGHAVLTAYLGQDTEVAVPATMDGISVAALSGTYQNHDRITKVTIPAGVVSVDETAFAGCYGITGFTVDPANAGLSSDADGVLFSKDGSLLLRYPVGKHQSSGTYRIPAGVVNVGGYAFEGYNTPGIEIPSNVRVIGDYAFANTRNFNGVIKWEEGTQTIGTFAFYKCTNLKLLDQSALPASVTKLGVYAFAECSNIQIDISKSSITEIPDYLFYNCDNLHNLTLPQTVTSVGAYAFSECNNLNEVIFDAALMQIREGAFAKCGNLHTVNIPEGVTAIENNTFNGCQNLNTVVLPDTLKTIGDGAFAGCRNIHSINIPKGVTYISNTSFDGVDTTAIALNVKVGKTKLNQAKRKGKKLTIRWKKTADAKGYVVYRSMKKNGGYKKVKTISKVSVCKFSQMAKKLKKNRKYYYKVKVYKVVLGKKYFSGFSNVKAVR